MAQWIKHNMCGQEYQELLWVSLLSTSQGTPEIIVHRLLVFKLAVPVFFFLPALTQSGLSWGHVFGDGPYLESYLKPFYQLKQTWWTSLSVVSQLPRWILQQVSKCQESSMFFLPQLLRGVNSVISTCGMCQCDQRARAKHGSMLKRSFITALWLHCSDRDFCSIEPPNQTFQQCQRCAGTEAREAGVPKVGLSVLTALRLAFPQLLRQKKYEFLQVWK